MHDRFDHIFVPNLQAMQRFQYLPNVWINFITKKKCIFFLDLTKEVVDVCSGLETVNVAIAVDVEFMFISSSYAWMDGI